MTQFDESSKFNEAIFKYRRCGRPSCLGHAWQLACMRKFFRVAIREAKQKPSDWRIVCSVLTALTKVCSVVDDGHSLKSAQSSWIFAGLVAFTLSRTCQRKKPLYLLHQSMVCFGHTGVHFYETIGNFFFNLKICHIFDGTLLHTNGYLIVGF